MESSSLDPDSFTGWLVLQQILQPQLPLLAITSLLLITGLLIISALVSGAEVALFSLTPTEIGQLKTSRDFAEQQISHLLRNPKRLLATILLVNNITNISIITIAALALSRTDYGLGQNGPIGLLIVLAISFVIVLFGEVIPKIYATQNQLKLAKRVITLLVAADIVLAPFSWLLTLISRWAEPNETRKGMPSTIAELSKSLENNKDETTTNEEKEILKGIVNFGSISAKQIMRSRVDITAFDLEWDFHELMDKINKSGYSRVPVYRETIDNIEGILYVKDLLPYIEEDEHFEWQRFLRHAHFVPENKKIDVLLRDFQRKRVHIAIVVDEYGGTSGLITLEDIMEEIVGEINDEFDENEFSYAQLDEHTYVFEGRTSLNDFCKVIDVPPALFEKAKGESESLGGLLLEMNATLPHAGEKITFDRFVFSVVSVDKKRIKKVKVQVMSEA